MRLRIAVAERVCAASIRRPPSVHHPFERERVEQRDRMHMAVTGEMAVMTVDHRDARTDETRDGEHGYPGAEREGGVGVAQVVEPTDRFDTGGDLRGPPVAAAEGAKVDPATARVREEDRVDRGRQPVEHLNRLCLQRHRASAQPRLGVLDPAVRERTPHVDDAGLAIDVVLLGPEQL